MLRRFLAKAIALSLTVFALQVAIVAVQPVGAELRDVRALPAGKVDVVLLGDSTVFADHGSRLSTADLHQTFVPDHRVGMIAHASYHMAVYAAFARAMEEQAYRSRRLIVPINLRSFSVSWDSQPDYQFTATIFALEHSSLLGRAVYHPLRVFKAFDPAPDAHQRFDAMPAGGGDVAIGVMKDFSAPEYESPTIERSGRVIALHYMSPLLRTHRRVQQMVELASRLRAVGVEPLFYVTPVDYEECASVLGPSFDERLMANVDVLRAALAAQQVSVLDLSHLLESQFFNWRGELYPNEHVVEEGRRRIAARLAQRLQD